jgi:peptidoglycan/LPS O-acetylase OafA/YrhL
MTTVSNRATTSRIAFLDSCRAIAALSVLIQHSLEGGGILSLTSSGFGQTVLNLGEVGVLIFFMVSGYIIPASLEKAKSQSVFWVRRAFRVYPLYFAIMLFTLVSYHFVLGVEIPPAWRLLPHLAFVQSWIGFPDFVGGSWTLFIELVWYGLFSALYALGLNRRSDVVFYLPLGCLVALEAVSLASGVRLPFGKVCLLMTCFLGLIAFRHHQGDLSRERFITLSALYLVVIFSGLYIGFGIYHGSGEVAPYLSCVVVSWLLGYAIFYVLFASGLHIASLSWVAACSYSIYLVHSPVIQLLKGVGLSGFMQVAVVWMVTIAAAIVTYRWIEKPFMDWGHGLTRRSAALPSAPLANGGPSGSQAA